MCSQLNQVVNSLVIWSSVGERDDGEPIIQPITSSRFSMGDARDGQAYIKKEWCRFVGFHCLFEPICRPAKQSFLEAQRAAPPLGRVKFFDFVSAMVKFALSPNAELRTEIAAQRNLFSWPDPPTADRHLRQRILCMHIRRGDKLAGHGRDTVRDVPLSELIELAVKMARNINATHITCASDDPVMLERLRAGLADSMPFVNFIAAPAPGDRSERTGEALPFLATLYLLAEADAMIGSFGSNVARFLLPLMTAVHCSPLWDDGYPQFIDLDGLAGQDDVVNGTYFCHPHDVYNSPDHQLSRGTRGTCRWWDGGAWWNATSKARNVSYESLDLPAAQSDARAAPSSFPSVLSRFNRCLNRQPKQNEEYHLWLASAHPEIGNMFRGYWHAFSDALLANKQLAVQYNPDDDSRMVSSGDAVGASDDGHIQERFVALFGAALRLPRLAPGSCRKCTSSSWNSRFQDVKPSELRCLLEATNCTDGVDPRMLLQLRSAVDNTTRLKSSDAVYVCATSAMAALVDATAMPATRLYRDAQRFRAYFTNALVYDRLIADTMFRFGIAVHLRLIKPGFDHAYSRNSDTCSNLVDREWLQSTCRNYTWKSVLRVLREDQMAALGPALVLSDANALTEDLLKYLGAHGIAAHGFVYSGISAHDQPTVTFLEWWFMTRSHKIIYAGQAAMDARTSGFTRSASFMASAPSEPVQPSGCPKPAGCMHSATSCFNNLLIQFTVDHPSECQSSSLVSSSGHELSTP